MTPFKLRALGLAGCVLVPGRSAYPLKDGTPTHFVALTATLMRAEPSLQRWVEAPPIDCRHAASLGYRVVRDYDDAAACGLV